MRSASVFATSHMLRAVGAFVVLTSLIVAQGCAGKAVDAGDGDGDGDSTGDGDIRGDGDGDIRGDGDGDAPPLALDPREVIVELTEEQFGALCDAVAEAYGGYGSSVDCGEGLSATASPDRQTCIDGSSQLPPNCTATVGDTLSCFDSIVQDCVFEHPGCLALFSCAQ